ncbi:MAG TPA: helicase-related protein [Microlunatus sp.]
MQDQIEVAPGSTVVVRDEEWLVSAVEQTSDGQLLHVIGLSELVRGSSASFFESLDTIRPLDPAQSRLVSDVSPGHRRARLWLEATGRKTPRPLADAKLGVATRGLADPLIYQQTAVTRALDPAHLRPRILLADTVGLGKTLEIGMILSELVRRGRGERILVVCPRHVLEQIQLELWTRFALPFVRLDSSGVQRVKQKLPATRNPFTYFRRVIISMDTLKQARFERDLRHHRWDAVVIDESHNVTNVAAQNNRLARTLAPNTDALILASATPHNGRKESFSELVRLLDPTAVRADGDLDPERVSSLVVRRHRHSPAVAEIVGDRWAERRPPNNRLVQASPMENAVARELDEVWLHPRSGRSPHSGRNHLFGWTLAKAFLSSPAAMAESLQNRIRAICDDPSEDQQVELRALESLDALNAACVPEQSGKYAALLDELRTIDVVGTNRAVVFAERVATLHWLQAQLQADLGLAGNAVQIMHGGLSDDEQLRIVDSFKQSTSPIRILVTGDVASEGVNLHQQCHELIHYDIPWSLIRIEQRNGRIDRYGQIHPPRITTLLLDPDSDSFAGDLRVLSRLVEKEEEAHTALGDASWLMGEHSVKAEEDAIREVLAGNRDFGEVVPGLADALAVDPISAFLAGDDDEEDAPEIETVDDSVYDRDIDFLREAVHEAFITPEAPVTRNGIGWREYRQQGLVEIEPPEDLRRRLEVLPQSYLTERRVTELFKLATTRQRGDQLLAEALSDEVDSTWPEAHYLAPLHPVLEWAADRCLATLGRGRTFVVRGDVPEPTMLLSGTLTNRRGQVVAASTVAVSFPDPDNPDFGLTTVHDELSDAVAELGFAGEVHNPGPVDVARLQPLVPAAVRLAAAKLRQDLAVASQAAAERVDAWTRRSRAWLNEADALIQRHDVQRRRAGVLSEQELVESMQPSRQLVRPLLLVVPADTPVTERQRDGDE